MRGMRSGYALVLAIAACGCGDRIGPAAPQDRAGPVRLVRCRTASTLPILDADASVYGGLLGTVGGGGSGELVGIGRFVGVGLGGGGAGAGAAAKPATVSLGTPSVTGALAPEAISRVLQRRTSELGACAAKEKQLLASGPASSRAVVSWRFTVGPGGRVIHAAATSHVLSPPLAECVTGVLRATVFPAAPGGRVVAVTLPIVFDSTGAAPEHAPEADPVPPWTPFAIDSIEGSTDTVKIARAAEGALRTKLGAIDACFASSPVTGSLRALLALDADGELGSVRAGGLGDKALEACVENAVTGLRVVTPVSEAVELACDLSRGDAKPWRVTVDRAGYGVVEVSRTRVRSGDQMLSAGEDPDALAEHAMYLLVADPDATGAMLVLAMRWTREADATIVALRPAAPKGAPPAPPLYLAMGQTAASEGSGIETDDPSRPTLQIGATSVTACVSRWSHAAKLADAGAVGAAASKLAERCRSRSCSSALALALDRDAAVKDLLEVAGAARRAGFERAIVVRGGGGKPPPKPGEGEDEPAGVGCPPPSGGS